MTQSDADLVPVICSGCGSVLGLALPGRRIYCADCRVWVQADERLVPVRERPQTRGRTYPCCHVWLKSGKHRRPCPGRGRRQRIVR
jgi:hypothetical protein